MSNATQLFHSRDLIKYLPDLLDGDDPILKRPEAKEILRTDPLAADALLAVGRAVNTYRLGRRERLRPARKVVGSIEVARPILTAVDCLTRQLADVLADHATYLLTKGIGDTWNSHSDRPEYAVDNHEARLQTVMEVAEACDVDLPWTPPVLQRDDRDATLEGSAKLLRAVVQLSPQRDPELIGLYLLLIRSLRGSLVTGAEWLRFASTCSSSNVHALALHHASRGFAQADDMGSALKSSIAASATHEADAVGSYISMAFAAWAGQARQATRFSESLLQHPISAHLGMQILNDRADWRSCFETHPAVVDELTAVLPDEIGGTIRMAVER